jgi:hypothetical protein
MKLAIGLLVLILPLEIIQAQDLFHRYDVELVKRFSNSKGAKNLQSQSIQGYAGNSKATFVYTSDGSLKIYDPLQNRVAVLGKDYDILQSVAYPETSGIFQFDEWYLSFFRYYGFEICKLNGMSVSKITTIPDSFRSPEGLLLYKNFLFVHDED